jgi:hypothetical protein
MTDVTEKVMDPSGGEQETADVATPAAAPSAEAPKEATPKAVKTDGERIKEAIARGQDKPKHQAFKEWISESTNGEVEADYDTIVMVMSLINGYRQTPEFKALSAKLAAEGGTSTKEATPKTPEEIRAFAQKAEETAARQAKAKATADARAERARALLAQLEAEEAGETDDDADDDEVVNDAESEDDAF